MAETKGLVQQLKVTPALVIAWVWIGPTPTNTEVLYILRPSDAAANVGEFQNSMVDALAAALVNRREVAAIHGESDAEITTLRIDPV